MLGTVGQTAEKSLETSILGMSKLPLNHISAYMLKIEKGTRYDCDGIKNAVPDEEAVCELYLQAVSQLAENGFSQYEISNFSKAGFESRHNLKYFRALRGLHWNRPVHTLLL